MASRAMATHNGPPPTKAPASSEAPCASLYIKNLPEKLQKADLRMSLYMLFATYGPVLDIVVMKNKSMRGQAHVVFRDIQASTQAMRALQGFDFFDKEMKIQYAKGRSNVFTKLEGVYRPPNVAAPTTEGQASIFTAPSVTAPTGSTTQGTLKAPGAAAVDGPKSDQESTKGVKRPRDDESDGEEAPMEEDDDDDVSMEASSDEE